MIAVIVIFAVPVSQLRTMSVRAECCCPDPTRCHCPDHDSPVPGHATMKACHRTTDVSIGSSLPEFPAPPAVAVGAPARRVATVAVALRLPHAPPSPARPRGPS